MGGEFGRVQRRERRPVDVDHPLVGRATPLLLRQREELVGMRQQRLAELVEKRRPLLGSGVGPRSRIEGGPGRRDRAVDLGWLGSGADAITVSVAGLMSS